MENYKKPVLKMTEVKSDFPGTVERVLRNFSITQKDLAKLLGVSRHTIMAWKSGEYLPNHEFFFDMLRRLDSIKDSVRHNEKTDKFEPLKMPYCEKGYVRDMIDELGIAETLFNLLMMTGGAKMDDIVDGCFVGDKYFIGD